MKNFLSLLYLVLFICSSARAQDRTVTGTVTDKDDKLPLPGVSVIVKGTKLGTQTNADGKFALKVPEANTSLQFSFIGYTTQEISIPSSNIVNVVMGTDTKQLEAVVVTALGITRTRNQVPYAAQQVTGDEISKNRSTNVLGSFSGKVSGLEIRQNNALGSSVNVVSRGIRSITGNNQALFVIDGVPVSNDNTNEANTKKGTSQNQGSGGYDYGSPASDINPDDIASITYLKGAAASALYGSRGGNGVIIITTKKGSKGLGITFNSGISVGFMDKATFPKYQKEYGGGYSPEFLKEDVDGDGIKDDVYPTNADASYGVKFDPNLQVYQWDAFDKTSSNFKKARPWVAAANDPSSFFENPISDNQSILITNGNDNGTFKLGYARSNERGFLPNSKINKNTIDFGGTYNITPKLIAGASVNFYNVNGLGRYGTGYDNENRNIMTSFREWWQVNTDIKEQKNTYFRSGGENVSWCRKSPTDLTPIYWDNPYFVRYQDYENDTRNRYLGNINLNYKPLEWLNILGRISLDSYAQLKEERKAWGTVGFPYYSRENQSFNETNYDLLANMDRNVSPDLNFKGLLGLNIRKQHQEIINASTNGGLVAPKVYSLANSLNIPEPPIEFDRRREVIGVFAGTTFTYKNMLSLDGTIRRDVSTTLPKGNNVYYYPSVSLGFTFSELLKNSAEWLSYGKLRANYAEVGNDADYYSTIDTYENIAPFGSSSQTSADHTKNNPNLKPERTRSIETGLEMSFLNNRLGFDATYYKTNTVNQILPVLVSAATGYTAKYLNSGTVQNKGFEISLNGTPIQATDFIWKVTANWTRNRNTITELFKDATGKQALNLQLGLFQGGITSNASLNEPFGMLRGTDFIYRDGQKVVGSDGNYLKTNTSNVSIGNPNPDWIAGITNSFTYKGVSLSFLIDIRKGGSVFSADMYYGLATGLYPETVGLNDLGNPSRSPISKGGGFIRPGVTEDGKPNTIRLENNVQAFGYSKNPDAAFIYDASYVKLREVVISYSLPPSLITKFGPIKGVDLSLIGRNLWIIHKNLPYSDPEEGLSSGNLQGYQVGAYPTTRTFALNLKLKF